MRTTCCGEGEGDGRSGVWYEETPTLLGRRCLYEREAIDLGILSNHADLTKKLDQSERQ